MQPNVLGFIYALKDPRTGAIRYVGVTTDVKKRAREHFKSRREFQTAKGKWIRELEAQGLRPMCEILETGFDNWIAAERRWIKHLRSLGCDLTNSTLGGEGTHGLVHSPATRAKLSRPRSPEGRAKIAAANGRRIYTPEMRARLSKIASARHPVITPEHAKKISNALKGKVKSAEQRLNMSKAKIAWFNADPSRREALRLQPQSPETRAKIAATRTGQRHLPEARAKVSQALRQQYANGSRKPRRTPSSPETRAKVSAALRGRFQSQETRAKRAATLRGRIVSAETRAKISATKRRKREENVS